MKKYFIGTSVVAVLLVIGTAFVLASHHKTVTAPSVVRKSYVALGDSVAAGVGLKDDSDSSACNRTNQAYPNLVAASLNYKVTNLACSGTTLTAGILGKQDVNQLLVAPQIDQLFALPRPALISLTVGANDINWTGLITNCYVSECGSLSDTQVVDAQLTTVGANLRTVLGDIQNHYGTDVPPVVITGYHQVFPSTSSSSCSDLTNIDGAEQAWGRQMQAALNTTLSNAVTGYAFATFTPVDFSGHELCTIDPWVQGLADKQPYHPTATGQTAFAKQIVTALKARK